MPSTPKSPEYTNLTPTNKDWDICYGPVTSRRFGQSVGINPLGTHRKVCSYDCPYCDLGPTLMKMNQIKKHMDFLPAKTLLEKIKDGLVSCIGSNQKIDTICISGFGDPGLYPELDDLIIGLIEIKRNLELRAPLVLLTNGAHMATRRLTTALNLLDEVHVKMDAGNDRVLKAINNPIVRVTVAKLISLVRPLKNLVIQSFFCQGVVNNTRNEDIEDWIEAIGIIKPQKIHLLTFNRPPHISGLVRVSEDDLYTIGTRLKRRTGIDFQVFN